MNFSEKLLELRKKEGLSQEELADRIDVSRQTVSKWESGQTTPEMEKLLELSKLFNISLDELTVNEFNKEEKEEAKPKKKKHKLLKVFLIIIAIYLVLSLLKFILLTRHRLIVDSFSEENYSAVSTVKFYDDDTEPNPTYTYLYIRKDGNRYIEESYNDIGEGVLPYTIEYVDLENSKAYDFMYEEDTGKFKVFDITKGDMIEDKEMFWNGLKEAKPLKDITNIPSNIGMRLLYSINPFIIYDPFNKVLLINTPFNITMKSEYNRDYLMTNCTIKVWDSEKRTTYNIGYDYVPDHFDGTRIENPFEKYKDMIVYNET